MASCGGGGGIRKNSQDATINAMQTAVPTALKTWRKDSLRLAELSNGTFSLLLAYSSPFCTGSGSDSCTTPVIAQYR